MQIGKLQMSGRDGVVHGTGSYTAFARSGGVRYTGWRCLLAWWWRGRVGRSAPVARAGGCRARS